MIEVDADGWCRSPAHAIERIESPNFDGRPEGSEPSLLVVHNISLPPGRFGDRWIDALFTNTLDRAAHPYFGELDGLRVSSHFLVRRSGAIAQFVSCDARAWHAGVSCFDGRERCNDFSIGIELEGSDDVAFEAAQYASLSTLTNALMRRYPLTAAAGHSEIAPGRKTDPGPCFDWNLFLSDVDGRLRRS